MNKILAFLFAALISVSAMAGRDDVVVMFSTQGPDTYADGTLVVDGEVYALVWTPNGEEFAGINADGTAAGNSKIVLKAPVAKDGKCPLIRFTVDETDVSANYRNGTWGVYLMDTRKFKVDENGALTDEVESVGGEAVNGYGNVVAGVANRIISAGANAAATAGMKSKVPANGGNLKINGIKLIGDNVYVYVSGSLPCMQYGLKSGKPGGMKSDGKAYYGTGDREMVIVTPRNDDGEIISVEAK